MLSSKLDQLLRHELSAGNSVSGEYVNQFADCKILVILSKPFLAKHSAIAELEEFENRDSHYPVGRGYKDGKHQEILLAPLR